jgi:hypothetical protein
MHKNFNSLPLPVLVIGGAVLGLAAAYLVVNLLAGMAWIAGPIIGALWGLSLYKPNR